MAKRRSTIPKYKRRRKGSLVGRIAGWIVKIILAFLIISVLWVLAYRFVNPPITITMIGDLVAGRGATRDWMPISQQTAKNAFLWQGGGYARKGVEAWFTFLIEQLWGKRRIMEVYLNLAETGIGTYGVNAGSQRYFGHDASAMSPTEAARLAAVLPLPKKRGAIAPKGFTRRYGNIIAARIPIVARDGLDACIYKGVSAPVNKAPPPVAKKPRPVPGAEFESAKPLPPVETTPAEPAVSPAPTEPSQPPPETNQVAPPAEQPQPPSNEF
jgi:monofunctional biosynthetic peptidoglycan transglycosylase